MNIAEPDSKPLLWSCKAPTIDLVLGSHGGRTERKRVLHAVAKLAGSGTFALVLVLIRRAQLRGVKRD